MAVSLKGMKNVEELKAMCRERGLKVGGRKEDLVRRLQQYATLESAGMVMSKDKQAVIDRDIDLVLGEYEQLEITSQEEFELACEYRTEKLKPALRKLDLEFDPVTELQEMATKAMKALKLARSKKINARLVQVNTAIAAWNDKVTSKQLESHETTVAAMQETAEETAKERVARLVREGRVEEALAAKAELDSGSVKPAIAPPPLVVKGAKARGVSVTKAWRYEILDVGKLKPEFTKTVPDAEKIRDAVKEHEGGAEAVVGKGSIRCYEQSTVRGGSAL